MRTSPAQRKAALAWEATCERLRFMLQPPEGATEPTREEQLAAYHLAQKALEALRQAFDIGPEDAAPQRAPPTDGDERQGGGS